MTKLFLCKSIEAFSFLIKNKSFKDRAKNDRHKLLIVFGQISISFSDQFMRLFVGGFFHYIYWCQVYFIVMIMIDVVRCTVDMWCGQTNINFLIFAASHIWSVRRLVYQTCVRYCQLMVSILIMVIQGSVFGNRLSCSRRD